VEIFIPVWRKFCMSFRGRGSSWRGGVWMAKMRLVRADKIPICRLVEENTDSQATAMMQAELLQKKYLRDEELEEILKEKLKRTDPEAYRLLCEIDRRQDKVIEDILYYAEHIRRINYQSNTLLKRFDVRGERREVNVGQGNYLFGLFG